VLLHGFSATFGCPVFILTSLSYVARVSRFLDPTTACTCWEIQWSGGVVLLSCQRLSSLRSVLPLWTNIAQHRCLLFGVSCFTPLAVQFFSVCMKAVAVLCAIVLYVLLCAVKTMLESRYLCAAPNSLFSHNGAGHVWLVCDVGALMSFHVKWQKQVLQVKGHQDVHQSCGCSLRHCHVCYAVCCQDMDHACLRCRSPNVISRKVSEAGTSSQVADISSFIFCCCPSWTLYLLPRKRRLHSYCQASQKHMSTWYLADDSSLI